VRAAAALILEFFTVLIRYDEAMMDYTTPSMMNHRAIEKQILFSASADADDDAAAGAEAPAKARRIEAAKSSIITQALATQPPRRTPSQVNIICNSLLSNPFFKMQPTPLQPDIAAHLVLLDVPAGEIAISEVGVKYILAFVRKLRPNCAHGFLTPRAECRCLRRCLLNLEWPLQFVARKREASCRRGRRRGRC
jgi:hypothetical protein